MFIISIYNTALVSPFWTDDDDDTMAIHENIETELVYILNPNAEYQVFKFTALKAATDNFSDGNKLGKGGFGPVYKVQRQFYLVIFLI